MGAFGVTPDTVHLIAQLIRHQRGMMTAIEKWIAKQEPCRTNLELSCVTGIMREVLDDYEAQLSAVEIREEAVETT